MKKGKLFGIALGSLIILALLLSGCSGGNANTTKPGQSSTTSAPSVASLLTTSKTTSTVAQLPTSKPAETSAAPNQAVTDLLVTAAKFTTIKYDMVISLPGMDTTTMSLWMKNNKYRTETTSAGLKGISLMDASAGTYYVYMPDQNTAMKMKFAPSMAPQTIAYSANLINQMSPMITGTETIDGISCWVVASSLGQDTYKIWIWKDNGVPIRMEMTASSGKTVIEYKNIDLSDIPDSMFDLPAGVTITEYSAPTP
jgi:outer membrane lipoprotein-sorting protein